MIVNDLYKPGNKLDPEKRKAVLAAIAAGGEDNRKIAAELGVSAKTVAMIRRYAKGEINLAAGKRIDGTPVPDEPVAVASGDTLKEFTPFDMQSGRICTEEETKGPLKAVTTASAVMAPPGETVPMTIRMDGGGTRTVRITKETAELIRQQRPQADQGKVSDGSVSEPWRAVEEALWMRDRNQERLLELSEELHTCLRDCEQLRPEIVEEYNRRVRLDNAEE